MIDMEDENWIKTKESIIGKNDDFRSKMSGIMFDNLYRRHPDTNQKVFLKMVHKVCQNMLAPQIVSVQPISSPVAQIHTLRVCYERPKEPIHLVKPLSPFDVDFRSDAQKYKDQEKEYYTILAV